MDAKGGGLCDLGVVIVNVYSNRCCVDIVETCFGYIIGNIDDE